MHTVQECHPIVDRHGTVVELGAVSVACGSSVNTLGRTVFPHRAESAVSAIGIRGAVAACNVSKGKVEFCGDLLRPPGNEVVLRSGGHAQYRALVFKGEILVLIAVAPSSRETNVHKVWH